MLAVFQDGNGENRAGYSVDDIVMPLGENFNAEPQTNTSHTQTKNGEFYRTVG